VNTVRGRLDDKMNENMSVVQGQIERVSQRVNQETEVLKERFATKRVSENLPAAGSSEQSKVMGVNSTGHNTITPSGCVSETNCSQSGSACSDVANVEISDVNNTTVVNESS
jgi:hypothetical protein